MHLQPKALLFPSILIIAHLYLNILEICQLYCIYLIINYFLSSKKKNNITCMYN